MFDKASSRAMATVMPWAVDTPFWEHAANSSGGTPRMAAMDDPPKVVDAIWWVALHPREEFPVGWQAKSTDIAHQVFPDLTERLAANIARRWQIETAPPAPVTPGTLYAPMPSGTTVEGGVKERMREEGTVKERADAGS